jgi:hypothetical protein
LAFIFDSSISMGFDPEKGLGEYHFAVLAVYSILQSLKKRNLAHLLNYAALNFSHRTVCSGWRGYSEINEVKRAIFRYQGLNTTLDPVALRDLRVTRRGRFIAFMLSDTGFNTLDNAVEIASEIRLATSSGIAGYFLFQLGEPSTFSEMLRKDGVPVLPVKSAEDFLHRSIEFTKELYAETA